MKEIDGVSFNDADAELVELLSERVRLKFSDLIRFGDKNGERNDVRFAYKVRDSAEDRADKAVIVVRAKRKKGTASIRLSKRAKHDTKLVPLNIESIDHILDAAESLYIRYSNLCKSGWRTL